MPNGILKRYTAGALSAAVIASIGFTALPATAATAESASSATSINVENNALDPHLVAQKDRINAFEKMLNDARAERGLHPVTFNATIASESFDWSEQMDRTGDYRHRNISEQRTEEFHGLSGNRGEILLDGGTSHSVTALFNAWKNSPGHWNIMMGSNYDTYGFASSEGYSTAVFRSNPTVGHLPSTYASSTDFFAGKADLPTVEERTVQAVSPTFDHKNYTYRIPSITGAYYAKDGKTIAPGTYTAKPGEFVFVNMYASDGWLISGISSWGESFPELENPIVTVTAPAPTFKVDERTVVIPSLTGVSYSLNGKTVNAGTHSVSDTAQSVKVAASPLAGYKLSGTASWSKDYPKKETPAQTVRPTAPTFKDADTKYIIPSIAGVTYKANGVTKSAGTHAANAGSKVTITAHANQGYNLSGTSSWSHTFSTPADDCKHFTDVKPGGSFYDPIMWLSCNDATTGYVDGSYRSGREITRGEAASFLYRIAGDGYISKTGRSFNDVKPGSAHYHAISWMADKGYSVGYVDGSYGVNRNISRGELASFAHRLAGAPDTVSTKSPFPDVNMGKSHGEAIIWLSEQKAISGYTDGTFRSSRHVTRGETAKILYVLKDA